MAESSGSYGPTGELLAFWWLAFLGSPILSQATGKLGGMQGWPLTQAGGLGSPSWGSTRAIGHVEPHFAHCAEKVEARTRAVDARSASGGRPRGEGK